MKKVMNRFFLFCVFAATTVPLHADNIGMLDRLDSVLQMQQHIDSVKRERIEYRKQHIGQETNPRIKLQIYHEIYRQYSVFQFDSAMAYVDKGLQLASAVNDNYYTDLNIIHKADLLSSGGLYSEAVKTVERIRESSIDSRLLFDYYFTCFRLYNFWAEYCNDNFYSPQYRDAAKYYLVKGIRYLSPQREGYEYYMGEYCNYVKSDPAASISHYHKALAKMKPDSHFYAMTCFALSDLYRIQENEQNFEKYLIMACISDAEHSTKQYLALQNLAVYLFEQDPDNIERAERYISISMNDAKFYNSRLRILEISQKLPVIVSTYQAKVKQQNDRMRYFLIFISVLALAMVAALYWIFRQNSLLTFSRKALAMTNEQLVGLNGRLKELNRQLIETNEKREGLAKLYIDLCAKYIDRLSRYQTLVKRKIKANQVNELLSQISSSRLSEEDAATFLNRFDKAFLDLYPTFITEFNQLLRPEARIDVGNHHAMTTELRIFALIRLGVRESSEIAGLLFYSPQTIYNYRSAMKNKAINRDSFERDVLKLCTVIRS